MRHFIYMNEGRRGGRAKKKEKHTRTQRRSHVNYSSVKKVLVFNVVCLFDVAGRRVVNKFWKRRWEIIISLGEGKFD